MTANRLAAGFMSRQYANYTAGDVELTGADYRAAAEVICRNAVDRADAIELLRMVGIEPGDFDRTEAKR